jgi:hypothetical protein
VNTGLTIQQFRRYFFGRQAVVSAADRTKKRVLNRFGAFVRTKARQSIRKRKRVSRPGEPPTNRKGQLKRFLFYGYEPQRDSVVIGPAKLNGSKFSIPEVIEHGGKTTVSVRQKKRGKRRRNHKRITYAARPFMQPAFQNEQQKLPQLWKDAIQT